MHYNSVVRQKLANAPSLILIISESVESDDAAVAWRRLNMNNKKDALLQRC